MLDYRSQLEARLWTLLEADSGFVAAFVAGRRIKMSGDGWLRERVLRAPADYPQIKIELRGGPAAPAPPRVFAMNSTSYTSATVNATVPITQQLAIVLTYDKLASADQTPTEAAIERVLWAAWPKFGLSYVAGSTFSTSRKNDSINNIVRPQTTILITFNLRPWLSDLTSAP